jgi:hypothetical protein
VAPVDGHGLLRWKARLDAVLRRILPWLSRSPEEHVPLRCEAAVSRGSDLGIDLGLRPTADPLSAMEITKVVSSFMPLYRQLAGRTAYESNLSVDE